MQQKQTPKREKSGKFKVYGSLSLVNTIEAIFKYLKKH